MIRFDFHFRRARQHRLFALSSGCPGVKHSHEQLACVYWAVARHIHRETGARRPA